MASPAMLLRILKFAVPSLLTTLPPLVCVVTIAHRSGPIALLALGLGQALGGIVAIVVTWGWDVSGPQGLASSTTEKRKALLAESLAARTALLLLLGPLMLVVASILAPSPHVALTLLTGCAVALQGLSPSWWFIGIGDARAIVRVEAIPRAAAALLSAATIGLLGNPWLYPVMTLLTLSGSYVLFYKKALSGLSGKSLAVREVAGSVKHNARSAGISMAAVAYNTATLPFAQIFAPSAAVEYASAARLMNYWALATITTNNALIGTIDREDNPIARAARRKALQLMSIQSVGLGIAATVLAPTLSKVLFNVPMTSPGLATAIGLAFAINGINTALSKYYLIPLGNVSSVLRITLLSALVGCSSIAPLALWQGSTGVVLSICLAEATTLVGLTLMLRTRSRRLGLGREPNRAKL